MSACPKPLRSPPKIRKAPKRVNAARKRKEFLRAYGSKERVAWVRSLPCVYCNALHPLIGSASAGKSHNAHTVTGGAGRKADANTIVPLCASHHQKFDDRLFPFDRKKSRDAVKHMAPTIESAWQAWLASLPKEPKV